MADCTAVRPVHDAEATPDAGGVAAKQAADKHCGKLCQTRKMILKARGRIDTQAHAELQQLAVSFAPSLFSAV